MTKIGIVGSGPEQLIPDLHDYKNKIDIWIGADRGAATLLNQQLTIDYAVGDFDSIDDQTLATIQLSAYQLKKFPVEKDETDLEIAIHLALSLKPDHVYLFGVTGGRLDHELINIQLLSTFLNHQVNAKIVDKHNVIELKSPNRYEVQAEKLYPYISFVPLTPTVKGLTLQGFYYPLENKDITWGSTLCISNKLLGNYGTFSFNEGILLLIKSRDVNHNPIPT